MLKYLVPLFFFLLAVGAIYVDEPDPNYYVLALTRCDIDTGYTIHGLWPEYNSTSWPQYCNTSNPLNFDTIGPLLPLMREYWYSCEMNHTDEWFWEHEWLKHGTCQNLDQFSYFATVLYLYEVLPWREYCGPGELQCLVPLNSAF